jgi:hypothetical protein
MNNRYQSSRRLALRGIAAALAALMALVVATVIVASEAVQTSPAAKSIPGTPERVDPASWEFSPYRVLVYVEFAAAPEWTVDGRKDMLAELESRANSFAGGVWQVKVTEKPAELHWNSAADVTRTASDSILPAALDADKLMLLGVGPSIDGHRQCRIREFDVRTESWGPVFLSRHPSRADFAEGTAAALWAALRPIVRIREMPEPGVVVVRVRGGELPIASPARSLIREGIALSPIIRHFDAQGRTLKNGVFPIDWTLLIVDSANGGAATCRVATAIQDPLDLKFDGRTEYLGLASIAPQESSTELIVQSRDRQRPLEDVEIFAQRPSEKSPRLVGRTDSRGAIKLESNGSLATVFVRSGDDLLARFPLVPGFEPSVTVKVEDNGRRLESGQLIARLSDELIDLVAQETLLKTRFRRQIIRGDSHSAVKTLIAIKLLKTSDSFLKSIDDRRSSLSAIGSDAAAAAWIDKQIDAIRPLATKYLLDATAIAQLEAAMNDR